MQEAFFWTSKYVKSFQFQDGIKKNVIFCLEKIVSKQQINDVHVAWTIRLLPLHKIMVMNVQKMS